MTARRHIRSGASQFLSCGKEYLEPQSHIVHNAKPNLRPSFILNLPTAAEARRLTIPLSKARSRHADVQHISRKKGDGGFVARP
jgi:hypothetical protein